MKISPKTLFGYSAISPSTIGVCDCFMCWLTIGYKYQGCFVTVWTIHCVSAFCIPYNIFCSWVSSCWYLVPQISWCEGPAKNDIFWDRYVVVCNWITICCLRLLLVLPIFHTGMQSSLLALALANRFFPDPLVGVPPAVSVCLLLPKAPPVAFISALSMNCFDYSLSNVT